MRLQRFQRIGQIRVAINNKAQRIVLPLHRGEKRSEVQGFFVGLAGWNLGFAKGIVAAVGDEIAAHRLAAEARQIDGERHVHSCPP